jgi:hypothetical protein
MTGQQDNERFHGLPEDGGGLDYSWFERLTGFQKVETRRQTQYKRQKWPGLPDGVWSKRPSYHYPHILPESYVDKNFYPSIYPDIRRYLEEKNIAAHSELLNLRSSQACCFNFLFPLRLDLDLAARVLSAALPSVRQVSAIEFEYTGPEGTTEWLGEPPGGKRGQNRTSIDTAVWWEDQGNRKRLTFIEWKYTESELGGCGGYVSKGNKQRDKCRTLRVQGILPERDCYIATGKDDRTRRKYWKHLALAGISPERFGNRSGCPFIGSFYQLMRQYLLAAYCKTHMNDVDEVALVLIGFRGNHDLLRVPNSVTHLGNDVVSAWNGLLTTAPPPRLVFVEDMLASAPSNEWREYIRERYGL